MRYVTPILLAAVVMVGHAERAEALDRVYMKNGTVVEGRILKTRFLQVFIETSTGNRTIPMNTVDRVERNVQPGSAARTIDRAAQDGEWNVRVTPGKNNTLRHTTQGYDDTFTITGGMLTTKVSAQYKFPPARCRFTPHGATVEVVAELGNRKHGKSLYTFTLAGKKLAGTLEWGKLGEDGKPKSAQFTLLGTQTKGAPVASVTPPPATAKKRPPTPVRAAAPKPKELTPEQKAKRDAAVAALRAAIASKVAGGARPKSSFKLGATSIRGTVTAAGADGVTVRSPMGSMSLSWRGISVNEAVALGRACKVDAALLRAVESAR